MLDSQTQILRATLADAPALSLLSAAVFPLGCPANTPPEDLADYISREHTPERYRAMLQDDRFTILIAKVADSLAGLALLAQAAAPAEMQSPSALELRRFYIDAAYHGRGVANVLMKEVLAVAAAQGEGSLWLSAFSGNGRAVAFYKRWGFRIAGEHVFLVGTDRQRDYLMVHERAIRFRQPQQLRQRKGRFLVEANSLAILPLLMIVGGGVLYHVSQKATPAAVDPFLALCISFGLASLVCLGLFIARQGFSASQLHRVNWTSVALACSLVAIESGYLIGYRAGLKLNITSFICNNLIALVLLGVGTLLYREAFTIRTGSGMVICAAGLLLLLR